jgi:cytochrome c oxidase subunit 2
MRFLKAITGGTALAGLSAFAAQAQDALGRPSQDGLWFQEAATPVMDQLLDVHRLVFIIICAIVALVMILMLYIMIRFREKANPVPSKTSHNTMIEIIWTIAPVILLLIMVVPSMQLLYYQDRLPETEMTVKVVGNTWNWQYSYPDYEDIDEIISNPIEEVQAREEGVPYLLATDAPLVVPIGTKVKVLVTSVNNMHSWAVPSFGVKMDAVPGLVNETWFEIYEEGTYYGQCSEICGIRHYKMPIEVLAVSKADFNQWVSNGGSFTEAVAETTASTTGAATLAARD